MTAFRFVRVLDEIGTAAALMAWNWPRNDLARKAKTIFPSARKMPRRDFAALTHPDGTMEMIPVEISDDGVSGVFDSPVRIGEDDCLELPPPFGDSE